MIQLSRSRDIWQNELIWWICKSLYLLLEREVKKPPTDVAEVKHGNWFLLDNCANAGVYCSNCHRKVYKAEYANQKLKSNFCHKLVSAKPVE